MGFFHDHHGEGHAPDGALDPHADARWNPDDIELTTVGIDIGSSTSHLIFSRLHLRRLGKHLSSRYVVISRESLSQSPILLTPYAVDYTIDADRLDVFVEQAFRDAGLTPAAVDTGAVILTGEAVKRTNARAIAELFAGEAGKFVCASAGHTMEAIMAAHGSGAVNRSRVGRQTVLNVDLGGGTAKLALVQNGVVIETATINIGGRLIALDEDGRINRIEPAAQVIAEALDIELRLGAVLDPADRQRLVDALADCLLAVIRREPLSPLGTELMLTPGLSATEPIEIITFSGGVSEYLDEPATEDFGDLGRGLAAAIRSRVEAHALPAPVEAPTNRIRATVLGASQFTVQVSGDTISISRPEMLPIRNLKVLYLRLPEDGDIHPDRISAEIRNSFRRSDLQEGQQVVALATNWNGTPHYAALRGLAEGVLHGMTNTVSAGLPLVLVFASDVGKLVGDILRHELAVTNDVISIDGIELRDFDYIDLGTVIQPAHVVPTVIKSLVFPEGVDRRAELVG